MAMPIIPMCSDICFSDSASMPKEERNNAFMMRGFWKMIAQDIDKRDDPLLFPDKVLHSGKKVSVRFALYEVKWVLFK